MDAIGEIWYQVGIVSKLPEIGLRTNVFSNFAVVQVWLNGAQSLKVWSVVKSVVMADQTTVVIRVRNYGAFFVYELQKPPCCDIIRYCSDGSAKKLNSPALNKTASSILANFNGKSLYVVHGFRCNTKRPCACFSQNMIQTAENIWKNSTLSVKNGEITRMY